MVHIRRHGIILSPTSLPFENKGVFNPAVAQKGNHLHMFYRAWNTQNRSTIGYCRLDGPLRVIERMKKPVLTSSGRSEYSIEDPRIVHIDGTYYMTYAAYDKKNCRIACAASKDLMTWQKMGVLSPELTYDKAEDLFRQCNGLKERYFLFESYFKDIVGKNVLLWEKDGILFPRKINGRYALLHRILPDIQVIYFRKFSDLTPSYWKAYLRNLSRYVVLESEYWYEVRNIGGGCPPIETEKGLLLIYHGVDDMDKGRIYRAGAALLDKKDPTKVIGHLKHPLFSPEKEWEKKGNVPNVVFPTGTARFDGRLYIYYGAADKRIAAVSCDIDELVHELIHEKDRLS